MTEFDDDQPDEIDGYRLVINVAGPGFSEKIELVLDDRSEADPEIVEVHGLAYERYCGVNADDWVEIRVDYVVARSLQVFHKHTEQEIMKALGAPSDTNLLDPTQTGTERQQP